MDPQRATIAGVATGTADGGVAIVRISGPRAQAIAAAVIEGGQGGLPRLPRPRVLALRTLVGGERALVATMPGPRSFTGEDVVELHVHAGSRNVAQIVDAVLDAGAVAAEAGAFTRRAFDNGRLSLDQAEGVAAVIGAQTQAALDQARRLVAGELGREVEAARARVELLRVEVEANLDFPEDVDASDERRFAASAAQLGAEVQRWLEGFERGRRARTRARIVIAGPPNAGKSELFNALLGRRRALVSSAAGTTRDYVEAELRLGGRELVLVDTAGLRETEDAIEIAGVALGREQIAGADVVVWVEGADQPILDRAEVDGQLREAVGAALLRVENKLDLGARRRGWLAVSASTGVGLEGLRAALTEELRVGGQQWIGLARHRDRAREAAAALVEARELIEASAGLELVALALAVAERSLGEITGRSALGPVGEDVLHAIFSSFCIGK